MGFTYGGIAQLGERLNGIQKVSGSIPLISTKTTNRKVKNLAVLSHANGKASRNQIKKWARSRLYFFRNTIIMDIDPSVAIYRALLSSLASMGSKTDKVRELLNAYFKCIQQGNEAYSHSLTILEDIYRIIENDALIHANSNTLYIELKNADAIL